MTRAPATRDAHGTGGDARPAFLAHDGEMGALIRAHDWSAHPLGSAEAWPQALKTAIRLMLNTRHPAYVFWGATGHCFYNDAYRPSIGPERHPGSLGRPAREVWDEIWGIIGPQIEQVMAGRGATWHENQLVPITRHGRLDEVYWTYSYSPIDDEDAPTGVGGVFVICNETTDQVLAERRLTAERERQRLMLQQMPGFAALLAGPEHRYEYVNDAYVEIAGDRGFVGRTVREMFPDIAGQGFYELLDRVYATGEPFAARAMPISLDREDGERFIDFLYEPVRDDAGQVAGIFVGGFDVTEQVRSERRLRQSEARHRFRVEIGDALRGLTAPSAIMAAVAERLGPHLGVDQANYYLIDGDRFVVTDEWRTAASRGVLGSHPLAGFGGSIPARMRAGEVLRLDDTRGVEGAEAFAAIGMAAVLSAPLRSGGRWAGGFHVHSAAPRAWTDEEAALVRETAERAWAAVEQARAEAELRASETRFRSLADAMPQLVWTADAAGRVDYYNGRRGRYAGIGGDDPGDWDWTPLIHPDDLGRTQASWREASMSGGPYACEHRLRLSDGRWAWHVSRAESVRDDTGAIAKWYGTAVDIADLKAAQEAADALNTTLEQRVEQRTAERDRLWTLSEDMLARADYTGMMSAVSPAWTRVLGFSEAELLARPYVEFMHPDDAGTTVAALVRMGETGAPTRFENRILCADGAYKSIEWTVAPEPDGMNFIAVGRDVSAERHRQAELEAAQEQLRQAQKMEAVGQLTGGVAHDFNNLLTIIKSSTDLLRRPDLPDERRRRYVDAIADTVGRASKLTGQLLAFARRQALKPEVFDAGDRLSAITDMLRTIMGSRVRIVAETDGASCFIEADAAQFDTALVNMAVNARDAMDGEGALMLAVRCAAGVPPLRGEPLRPGRFVAVSLADTGAGIAPDRLHHIFEPFYTTKEVGKGTGLGLSQVYGFARQSGGDVAVESMLGRGTTFTLYLPQVEHEGADEERAPADEPEPPKKGQGRRVLVVEDNAEVGAFATQVLQDLGYQTTWAGDAAEALRLLATADEFDVVFSDVVMPGMGGVEFGQEIRRRHPGLPVVLTSGYSAVLAEEGRHGFELLHKPYAAEELSRALRRVTQGRARKADRA